MKSRREKKTKKGKPCHRQKDGKNGREKMEAELAELDAIMANPDAHPEHKVDNDFYWTYGKKKEELQTLIDDWGEKQIEREDLEAEFKAGE